MRNGKGAVAALCDWEGNRRSNIALRYIHLHTPWPKDGRLALTYSTLLQRRKGSVYW